MIHLALVILAFFVVGYGILFLIGIAASGFEHGFGCGCLTMIVAAVILVIFLLIAI